MRRNSPTAPQQSPSAAPGSTPTKSPRTSKTAAATGVAPQKSREAILDEQLETEKALTADAGELELKADIADSAQFPPLIKTTSTPTMQMPGDAAAHLEYLVPPVRSSQTLLTAVICLTVAGIVVQFSKYILGHDYLLGLSEIFNVNSETSIPTWYSSFTLLLCAVLLAVIFKAKKKSEDRFAFHWGLLSLVFLYLSIDEGSHIHETIGTTIKLKVTGETHGYLHYTWVISGAALVLIVGVFYLGFLAHLPSKIRRLFIIAGTIYIGGALGMEMVSGNYFALHGSQNLTYQMMAVFEESLEMTGIVLFIYALMLYIASELRAVTVRIEEQGSRSTS